MTLMERRRALLMQPRNELNGFVDGDYTNGTSVYSVHNNVVTIETFCIGRNNMIILPLQKELLFSAGDTIRTRIDKITGSISGGLFIDMCLGQCNSTSQFVSNEAWGKYNTAMDIDQELTNDISGAQILINNRTVSRTGTDYSVRITIYRNGEQIFPEV